jgi:hypothetical protein
LPQIIVMADKPSDGREPPVMFRERVNVSDFESEHFATQLVERLGWAVGDADAIDPIGQPADWEAPSDVEPAASAGSGFSARPAQRAL